MTGNAKKAAVGGDELAANQGGILINRRFGRRSGWETVLGRQTDGERLSALGERGHARLNPRTRLVIHLAANERLHPFRLQLAAETFKRGKALEFSVAFRAAQEPGLALGKFGRDIARQ